MNYYHDLIASYSKLKRRSFKLNIHEAEAKKKSAAPKKAEPEKKDAAGERKEKKGADLEAAFQKAVEGYNAIQSNPQEYLQPKEIPGAVKPTLAQVVLHPQTGAIQTLKFDNSGRWVNLITKGQEKPQKYDHEQSAWYDFTRRFMEKNEMSDKEEGESTQQDKDNQDTAAALEAQTLDANQQALNPYQVELGLVPADGMTEAELDPALDFFSEDEEGLSPRYGFLSNLKTLFDSWINDVEVPLAAKIGGATQVIEFIKLAVDLQKNYSDDGEMGHPTGEQVSTLHRVVENIRLGSDGSLRLNVPDSTQDDEVLNFGLTRDGDRAKGLDQMLATIEAAKEVYNNELNKINDLENAIPDFEEIEIKKPDSAGKFVGQRGTTDEIILTGAGELDALIKLSFPGEGEDAEAKETRETDRQWRLEKLQDLVREAEAQLTPQQIAETLGRGLAAIDGVGIDTLLTEQSQELTQALIDRLQTSYPDTFKDEDSARNFVEDLANDATGFRAFATFLLLRQHVVREVFGEKNSPVLAIAGGTGWSHQGDIKNFRRKLDVGYFFNPKDAASIKTHLQGHLDTHGQGSKAEKFLETKTVQEFIDRGIIKSVDQLPPSMRGDPEKTELTIAAVSLKTIPTIGKGVNRGSMSAQTIASSDQKKGYNSSQRVTIHTEIEQAYKKRGKKAGRVTAARAALTTLKGIYRAVAGQGLNAKGTQKALFKELMKRVGGRTKIEDDKQREMFEQVAVLELITLGGIAADPQVNVTNITDTGESMYESDEVFKHELYKKVASGEWIIHYGARDADKSNYAQGNRQIFIRTKGTGRKRGRNIVRIASAESDGRTNIFYDSEYLEDKQEKAKKEKEKSPENSSTMLRQFLSAQSDLIQELLAN